MSDNQDALRCADALERRGYASLTMQTRLVDQEIAAHIRCLVAENEALKAELAEQARVNGMGGEREARLLAVNAEMVEALRDLEWAASGVEYMESEYANELSKARAALAKAGVSNG